MSSKIEQLIDEIEEYIDGCKYQTFSNTKIIVDKEEIDELLRELRLKTPDEIKQYQKIISKREEILNNAREKAEVLIAEATKQTNELISEHEIMQQAYAQAHEVILDAQQRAQMIMDNAASEANNMRTAAVQYTDSILADVEILLNQAISTTQTSYESFITKFNQYSDVVNANRMELNPPEPEPFVAGAATDNIADTGELNLELL